MISETLVTVEGPWEDGAKQIDDCQYLFAVDVRELEELTLRLTLVEAKAQAPLTSEDDSVYGVLSDGARPIRQDSTCRIFEIIFERKHIISYTVLNESYGRYPEPPEKFTGKLFRIFSWSHLLEFTRRMTYANDEHPGVLKHFQIACLNHVFDVISTHPPRIAVGKQDVEEPRIN